MTIFDDLPMNEAKRRTSEKWQQYSSDVLPMWVAEMDVMPPQIMLQNVCQKVIAGDLGYLSYQGFTDFANSFREYSANLWDLQIDLNNIYDDIDVLRGIRKCIDSVLKHNINAKVIVNEPVYPPFLKYLSDGYTREVVKLTSDNRLDFDALEKAFAYDISGQVDKIQNGNDISKVFVLCSPHNPTGTVHNYNELKKLIELAKKYCVVLIADEIHGSLIRGNERFIPLQKVLNDLNEPTFMSFTVTSASKTFSIPGMKSALIISNNNYEFCQKNNFRKGGGEYLGTYAQTICLKNAMPWLSKVISGLDENFEYFKQRMNELFGKINFEIPQGTYFAWVNFAPYLENNNQSAHQQILEKCKIAFNSGESFLSNTQQEEYRTYVRINLATSKEIIDEMFKRLKNLL